VTQLYHLHTPFVLAFLAFVLLFAPAIVHEHLELDARTLGDVRVRRFLEDCGVSRTEAAATVERAGREPGQAPTVSIDVTREGGAAVVTAHGESSIRATALTAVGGS